MVHSDLPVLVWLMTRPYVGIGTYLRTTSDSRPLSVANITHA